MDGLLLFAVIFLIFIGLIVPILAIKAFNRSAEVSEQLKLLRERIEQIESRSGEISQVEVVSRQDVLQQNTRTIAFEDSILTAELPGENSPEPESLPHRYSVESPLIPENTRSIDEEVNRQPSVMDGAFSALFRWFMQGNPLAKLGIILLFLGLSFLLRYSVENGLFPVELRLAVVSLFAIVMLFLGWRLRNKKPLYALVIQGGATGVLYLTVFGAFRLWNMLPVLPVFALLVLICIASVGLAILQKSLSLAMLACLGGYLAPLLMSTGSGNVIALFSFYLLLSLGILAVSVWQHWRELNLLGLLFTFGIGGLWGMNSYQPDDYLSCQLFLIINIIIFGILSVLLSLRSQKSALPVIDGVLVFAPPLIGFGMQYAMTESVAYGPAFSALAFGASYLIFAWYLARRYSPLRRMLLLAALAMGAAFTTLAIPLALSAHWTAMAWVLEGLGILWLGLQQQQRRMSYSGTALMVIAVGSAISALAQDSSLRSMAILFMVLSGCWMVAAWLWLQVEKRISTGLLAGGVLFWIMALTGIAGLLLQGISAVNYGILVLVTVSVLLWRKVGLRLSWSLLVHCQWLLWPAMFLMLCYQIEQQQLFTAYWRNVVWVFALPVAYWFLYRDAADLLPRFSQGLHLSLFWMIQLALGVEIFWLIHSFSWGMDAWGHGLVMATCGIVIYLVKEALRRAWWPFTRWPVLYGCLALMPVAAIALLFLVWTNLTDGVVLMQRFIPLLNPLEEGAAFAFAGIYVFSRINRPLLSLPQRQVIGYLFVALLLWWVNGSLVRALAWYGDITWNFTALWSSRLIQGAVALLWTLTSLMMMLQATRCQSRKKWLCGAILLGIVIIKLMLIDSAGGGGLMRALTFIGVAILVLIVGYFSPLPPKASGEEK